MASLSSCQGCSPAEGLHPSQGESSVSASQMRDVTVWYMATWNVRTLLDMDGSIETARQGGEASEASVVDERKIDQVVGELDKYRVVVAALQETKWFGSKVYKVGDSVVLTSGREVPIGSGVRQRGEGVAIVLAGPAVHAWKAGGCKWKAWSSRLVTATLDVGGGQQHVLSCYAPTFAASREDKDIFFDTLQQALSAIPSNECYVVLGNLGWWMSCGGMRGALMGMVKPMRREWSCYLFSQSMKLLSAIRGSGREISQERYRQADLATSKVQEKVLH